MSARQTWHTSGRSAAPQLIAKALYEAQTDAQGRPEILAKLYAGNLEQVIRDLSTVVVDFKWTEGIDEYFEVKHELLGWLSVGVTFDDDDEPLPGATQLPEVVEVRQAGKDITMEVPPDWMDAIGALAITAHMARKSQDKERRAESIHEAIDAEIRGYGGTA